MNENLIKHIQYKINSLKNEIKSIYYTQNEDDNNNTDYYMDKILECTHKIQVLNEIIISFGLQKNK